MFHTRFPQDFAFNPCAFCRAQAVKVEGSV